MAMTSNPATSALASASFITPDKLITHLGRYIEPTTGKMVGLSFDQAGHKINVDAATNGAVAPTVLFRAYESLRNTFYGKNLVRLGSFGNDKGMGQAWYDPATNTVYVDTTT